MCFQITSCQRCFAVLRMPAHCPHGGNHWCFVHCCFVLPRALLFSTLLLACSSAHHAQNAHTAPPLTPPLAPVAAAPACTAAPAQSGAPGPGPCAAAARQPQAASAPGGRRHAPAAARLQCPEASAAASVRAHRGCRRRPMRRAACGAAAAAAAVRRAVGQQGPGVRVSEFTSGRGQELGFGVLPAARASRARNAGVNASGC